MSIRHLGIFRQVDEGQVAVDCKVLRALHRRGRTLKSVLQLFRVGSAEELDESLARLEGVEDDGGAAPHWGNGRMVRLTANGDYWGLELVSQRQELANGGTPKKPAVVPDGE